MDRVVAEVLPRRARKVGLLVEFARAREVVGRLVGVHAGVRRVLLPGDATAEGARKAQQMAQRHGRLEVIGILAPPRHVLGGEIVERADRTVVNKAHHHHRHRPLARRGGGDWSGQREITVGVLEQRPAGVANGDGEVVGKLPAVQHGAHGRPGIVGSHRRRCRYDDKLCHDGPHLGICLRRVGRPRSAERETRSLEREYPLPLRRKKCTGAFSAIGIGSASPPMTLLGVFLQPGPGR
jgi:hypothetical protein